MNEFDIQSLRKKIKREPIEVNTIFYFIILRTNIIYKYLCVCLYIYIYIIKFVFLGKHR